MCTFYLPQLPVYWNMYQPAPVGANLHGNHRVHYIAFIWGNPLGSLIAFKKHI